MQKPARTEVAADPIPGAQPSTMVRVWDPVVRAFHWSLVAGFAIAWFTANRAEALHVWAGYAAAGLVALRLTWGFVGTRHARFADFARRPATVLAYLRAIMRGREARHIGHNPAGGAMVLALMLAVAATAFTGWLMFTDQFYGDDSIVALHSLAAHAMLGLVILHLAGVALASLRHRENLVRAMLTGCKRAAGADDID